MGKFKGIVYLSEQKYLEMYNNKTLDEDTQYVTDQEEVYGKSEVDAIVKRLQDQITTATGGEFTKVLVGGVYQPSFDADTKANASYVEEVKSSLEEQINSLQLASSQIPIFFSANMSIGVSLVSELVKKEVITWSKY